ncbi:hypothetical protein IMZ48_17260, partial [Candidatus Bathyarchaeota archaeon]|nr:hypothetical protein [Candidatus Bathyarchaeota archaeon]
MLPSSSTGSTSRHLKFPFSFPHHPEDANQELPREHPITWASLLSTCSFDSPITSLLLLPCPLAMEPPGPEHGHPHPEVERLIIVAPSIFVPITTDLAAPLVDKPRDNVQRIEQTMRNIDAHTAKAKANIVEIMVQEKKAIMREAKEQERAHPESVNVPTGIAPDEYDMVAQSLMARAVPGKNYNVREPPTPDFHARGPPDSLRDDYSRRVLTLAEQAVHQVEGYGERMESVQE